MRILQLNHRISAAAAEVVIISDSVIQKLLDAVRHQVPGLFRISEGIALVDMLAGFAHLVTIYEYTRPELNDTLALQAARHPILEMVSTRQVIKDTCMAMPRSNPPAEIRYYSSA